MLSRAGRLLAPLPLVLLAACGGEETPEVPALAVLTSELGGGALGAAYDQKIEATGGTTPYSFAIAAGDLPTGLMLLPDQGRITGNLGSPGAHTFTVEVKDAAGEAVTKDLSIYVTPDPVVITTAELDEAFTVTPYMMTLGAEGGVPPYEWSLGSGTLPAGLVLARDGRLAGTPSETGTFDLGVTATDTEDTATTKSLMLTVRSGTPMIDTETLPAGLVGDRYEVRLEASGGAGPYTWVVATGTVPPGLTLQDDGLIFGSPEAAGEFTFGVQVEDSNERTDSKAFTIQTFEPLSVATRSLPVAALGEPYDFQLEAAGGLAPYSWSTTDSFPAGIVMSADGRITGVPAQIGTNNLRIRVQDALQGVPRSARFTLRVQDARIYDVEPLVSFPPVCTATIVSYQTVEIPVASSFAISTISVSVEIDYDDTEANSRERLKVVLWAPDGRRSVLCGNGAGVRGSSGCSGSGNLNVTYGGPSGVSPQVPLRVFDGMNPQGTWRLQTAVVKPTTDAGNCQQSGTIRRVTLTMEPDSSPDPYIILSGFTYNNLLIDPWVRITGGGLPQQQINLSATLWHPGANGVREGGLGDDQPDPVQFTFTGTAQPPGASVAPDGTVRSGPETSRASPNSSVTATDATGTYSVTRPLHVTPPDWNPWVRNY